MKNKRRYQRYRVDHHEIQGKMTWADKVEIIDISSGGVRIKADSRLNIGKEYMITLGDGGNAAMVKGFVVHAEVTGSEIRHDGGQVLIYTVGIMFKENQTEKIDGILKSLEKPEIVTVPMADDRRLSIRFQITASRELILTSPTQFSVKVISLGGMLIKSELSLDINSRIPMELSLDADHTVNCIGRIASCIKVEATGQPLYETGVEFTGLTEHDTALIKTFIDYLSITPGTAL